MILCIFARIFWEPKCIPLVFVYFTPKCKICKYNFPIIELIDYTDFYY